MDNLARNMIQCEADGFGVHYGKWKATQPVVEIQKPEIPEGWKKCEYCGKPFKPIRGKRFCDVDCRRKAYDHSEKGKAIRREHTRRWKAKQAALGNSN